MLSLKKTKLLPSLRRLPTLPINLAPYLKPIVCLKNASLTEKTTTGIYLKSTGIYPKSTGIYPKSTGIYLKSTGIYLKSTGIYPKSTGIYLKSTGIYLKSTGIYPKSPYAHPKISLHTTQDPQTFVIELRNGWHCAGTAAHLIEKTN